MQASDEGIRYGGALSIYALWHFCTAWRDRMVCVFAWLFVCKRACVYEAPGDAARIAVIVSADHFLCSCVFRTRQDLVWRDDGAVYADGDQKAVEKSGPVFTAVRVFVHGCGDLVGKLCKSAPFDKLYSKDVRG